MSCENDCGQPMIEWSPGCYTANGSTIAVTIDIYRTFMPDPLNLGKTILTETRYVKPTSTGQMPFVPDFAAGDSIVAGACPLPQIVTAAPGDLENAWYQMPDGTVIAIKITTDVDSSGNLLAVQGYSLPTLQPIAGFSQNNLVTKTCPSPTNTGVNPSW